MVYRAVAWRSGVIVSAMLWCFFANTHSAHAAASLKITPASGTYEVGALVDVSFLLDTGGDAVNAVQADIQFPADKLQVVNPVASTSFISVWVTTPTYSNTDGTLKFQGGLPSPGIKTSGGVISTVSFRVKAAGRATITFASTSKVLRNDGEGTNILSSTGTADFTLKVPPPEGPVVKSPTHGDLNRWYNSPQVQFVWDSVDGASGYSYSFDQNAKVTPDETIEGITAATSMKATGDGVWFFHIRAKTDTWGGTTSFPVQIDTTPPASFTPTFDHDLITIEDVGTLRFVTTDGASGLDYYEVKQVTLTGDAATNSLFVESSSPYVIPKLGAGKYEFIVRAFDRAGNTTEGKGQLEVIASGVPFYARVPILRDPAVANGALVVLGSLFVGAASMLVLRRVRVRSTFQHDFERLERDAHRKAEQLQRELEQLRSAQRLVQSDLGPDPGLSPQPHQPPR